MASFKKLLLLGGVGAAAAAALLKRDKVAALLPGGSSDSSAGESSPAAPATGPSNYDAPGPVANTATPVPAPDAEVLTDTGAIDEEAEVAAAAAEAANIGGTVADYADDDEPSLAADEAERPLMEAGEGYAEGQEQAEAELVLAAEPDPAPGISDFQRQIDDTIEEASVPSAGEQVEPVLAPDFDSGAEPAHDPHPGPAEPLFTQSEAEPETTPATEAAPGLPDTAAAAAAAEAAAPEPEPEPLSTPGLPDTSADESEAPTTEWQPPQPPAPPEPAAAAETPPPDAPAEEEPNTYETFAMPSVRPAAEEPEPEPEPDQEPEASEPEPAAEDEPPAAPEEPKDEPGSGDDWRTWSGRAVDP